MKMREEKERGLGPQRAEKGEELSGKRCEGSKEEAEKIMRACRYLKFFGMMKRVSGMWRKALLSHVPEITNINPN